MCLFLCIGRVLGNYCSLQDPHLAGYLRKERVQQRLYKECLVRFFWCSFIFFCL